MLFHIQMYIKKFSVLFVEETIIQLCRGGQFYWSKPEDPEKTGGPGENHRPVASRRQILLQTMYIMFYTSRPYRDSNSQHQW